MKKKFSLWLNIATICLCLCAVAIGVYAATTATLKVSGNIGFKAHGCEVTITDYLITNASRDSQAVAPEDITTYYVDTTETAFPKATGIAIGKNTPFNFGAIYFVDNVSTGLVEDIVIKFEITNSSQFNVKATITKATSANSKITVSAPTSVVFGTNTDTKTKNIEIKLSLTKEANGEYANITTLSDLNISIEFAKTQDEAVDLKSGIVVKKFDDDYATTVQDIIGDAYCCDTISYETTGKHNYVQAFPYYIEMGKKGGEAIKWLIVGVDNGGAIAALAQEDKDAFAQGVMLNKEYYVLSEKTLENRLFDDSSNEYVTSKIREYLTGDFRTTYGFTQDDLDKIQERSVKEMYATDTISVEGATETKLENGQTFPEGVADAEDEFWLLSQTEIMTIFADDTIVCDEDEYKVFMSGRTTDWGASGAAGWWIRSPYADDASSARLVGFTGYSFYSSVSHGCGVRAAFKI